MNTTIRTVALVVFAVAVIVAIVGVQGRFGDGHSASGTTVISSVAYACDGGKSMAATFNTGTTTPIVKPGSPPTPTGTVDLTLSDGRAMSLTQTISADGARYANPDESFVFWSKGNGALVLENNKNKSFIGCVLVQPDPGGLSNVYESGSAGFSIRYPNGYMADPSYRYQELGPGHTIYGVKFTIPPALATSTNLATDSYVSVEELPAVASCTADSFLEQASSTLHMVTDGDTQYSVASSVGAGAGNRYEETVYAIPGTNPCMAVRYYIHYGVIENYPAGTVTQFDKQNLLDSFNQIRHTLVVNQ